MKNKKSYTVFKKVLWITTSFCIAALCMAAVDHKKNVFVRGIVAEVAMLESGANLVTQEDVIKEMQDAFGSPTNMLIGFAEVERMESIIEQNPFMKDVDVFVDANNFLHVSVTQREPIVRVVNETGVDYYLDLDTVRIPKSSHYTPRVLVANGQVDQKVLFTMAKRIYDDPFLKSLISQIYFDHDKRVIWIPKMGAKEILVGDEKNLADKIERLKIFYKEGLPNVGWDVYRTLDIQFAGQVIGKKA